MTLEAHREAAGVSRFGAEVLLDLSAGSAGGGGSRAFGSLAPSILACGDASARTFGAPGDLLHGAPHAITLTYREVASHGPARSFATPGVASVRVQ